MTTYGDVLAHLDKLQMHKIKLGLEAMRSFLNKVGFPERRLRFVHVAGTNGKGSICAAVAEVLRLAGYRVGVYTSPHLSSVRERFRIGKEFISENAFARLGAKIIEILAGEQITYFEFTTALALLWFEEEKVDLVMLETGMGGRLDATNVVTPLISVITSVSMDHEMYLGDTLEKITGEKAGIIKPGVPVISAAVDPRSKPVIEAVARENKAPLLVYRQDFDYSLGADNSWRWQGGEKLSNLVIDGLHSSRTSLAQQENDSVSIAVLQLLQKEGFSASVEQIRRGLASVQWPGRMEYFTLPAPQEPSRTVRYLLDGAHNPDGVRNLVKTLPMKFTYKRLIAIWGAMGDKDLTNTLGTVAPLVDIFIATMPEGERSATPEHILSFLPTEQQARSYSRRKVAEALQLAQELATPEDLIMVGGSLYLLGAIRSMLLGELAG
jgi:dihydrofolate synthase/folylpolyglutamate synthase